jgi:hypothetical protein
VFPFLPRFPFSRVSLSPAFPSLPPRKPFGTHPNARNTADSPRVYPQASLLTPAPITAWPPFAPGALAGGARGGLLS